MKKFLAAATTSNAIPELDGIEEDSETRQLSGCTLDTHLEAKNFPHMVWTVVIHSSA